MSYRIAEDTDVFCFNVSTKILSESLDGKFNSFKVFKFSYISSVIFCVTNPPQIVSVLSLIDGLLSYPRLSCLLPLRSGITFLFTQGFNSFCSRLGEAEGLFQKNTRNHHHMVNFVWLAVKYKTTYLCRKPPIGKSLYYTKKA